MEKNSYKINNDVLTIRSICGEYSFKMEESGTTENIHRIAQMMVSELKKAEESFTRAGAAINPHVLVLLANLNLSKKYVELRDRLDTLKHTLETKTKSLAHAKASAALIREDPPSSPPKADIVPEKNGNTPGLSSNPLESDIIDDLQHINSLLSDPESRIQSIQTPIHGEKDGPGSVPDQISQSSQIPEPNDTTTSAPESPSKTQEISEHEIIVPETIHENIQESIESEKISPSVEQADLDTAKKSPDLSSIPPIEVPTIQETNEIHAGSTQTPSDQTPSDQTPSEELSPAAKEENTKENHKNKDEEDDDDDDDEEEEEEEEENKVEKGKNKDAKEDKTKEVEIAKTAVPKIGESKTTAAHIEETRIEEMHIEKTQTNPETETSSPLTKSPNFETTKNINNQAHAVSTSSLESSAPPQKNSHEEKPSMGSFPIHTAAASYSLNKPVPSAPETGSMTETFELPSLKFLKNIDSKTEVDHESIRRDAELLEKKLGYFGIKGEVMGVSPGPVITTFEYKPDPGIKISKIVNLADDLALALSAYSIRIVAPIPGKDVMGIEIPNLKKSIVPFIDIVSSEDFINSTSKLPICLGKDIIGNPVVVELESMPHLLIAGATGTGKSVGLNAMITSILYKANPDEVKFLMIDPKRIELSLYNDIPHLITPVITDMKKATTALQWMVREMERRYDLLAKYQVRNIEQFNQKMINMAAEPEGTHEELPESISYIVIIIDELADLMMTASRDVELSLTRLAQMARAAGIHLILATQRPSVDVLTGIIKANFPTRISFQVSSKTDSRTIIDSNGAETLLGMGDMLFVPPGTARLTRVHGTYLSEEELIDVTSFLKEQQAPEYLFDVITEQQEELEQDYREDEYDEKYHEALEVVMATRQASISGIQRALRVGYNRAARIIDIMEKKGIVGPSDGAKPRQVLSGPTD